MDISIELIVRELKNHGISKEKIEEVYKAYLLADRIHKDQKRETGEYYINHPLNVAYNVLKMGVYDPDTISAALLHDTIEDAEFDYTKESIAVSINPTVAELVDGVTKMRSINFATKDEEIVANTRKLINGLTKDVRIIIVKLADRLHNMNTMSKKKPKKQKENAIETLDFFVPIAIAIGAYKVKNELEELSFKYIQPEVYKEINDRREQLRIKNQKLLEEMADKIRNKLKDKGIECEIVFRTQSMYTIYKKIQKGYKIENQYDLNYFKILVETIDDCYRVLGTVHSCYSPINGRFKDYICNPRTNNYQSLHTTVSDKHGKFVKIKVRTREMDKIDAYGIPAYWDIDNYDNVADLEYGKTIEETNKIIRKKCQFAKKLIELDESLHDNVDFFDTIQKVLLTDHVYAYTDNGQTIELPVGSTALDFACEVFPEKLDTITSIVVNGIEVAPNYVLKNNDRVQIFEDGKINHDNWENYATTESAKRKIKLIQKKRNNID
ncbi:MAG: bifunctional (p)ppGpp synthetase/guanosine-3',5'-bis(diphosphate) 3'-pyrophosphohydrolase [Bacilli bacterium]|nr:bifunctional (p)ppGpp synthetase/guanosine-3',5'-bis(diphosphate) 3'-pyrophosphohydrolase [Bacilli bacterium]